MKSKKLQRNIDGKWAKQEPTRQKEMSRLKTKKRRKHYLICNGTRKLNSWPLLPGVKGNSMGKSRHRK